MSAETTIEATVADLEAMPEDLVAEFWFVDLDEERIEAYRLDAGRYGHPTLYERGEVAPSTAVPGFAVPVDRAVAA
jgi:hypothetical protein